MQFKWRHYFIRFHTLHIIFDMNSINPSYIELHDITDGEIENKARKMDVYVIGRHSSHLHKS